MFIPVSIESQHRRGLVWVAGALFAGWDAMSKSTTRTVGDIQPGPGPDGPSTTETLSRDDAFETLSNRRRRFVLHYLQDVESAATLSDLAEQVAAWENETAVEAISAAERKRVYTSLQQFHLPKMDDMSVVAFDQREGTVRLTAAAADLDIYLEVVDAYDIPWALYYLGLSALGFLAVALALVGVPPFASVPFAGWTVFLLTALAVSSGCHYLRSRRMRLGSNTRPPEVSP